MSETQKERGERLRREKTPAHWHHPGPDKNGVPCGCEISDLITENEKNHARALAAEKRVGEVAAVRDLLIAQLLLDSEWTYEQWRGWAEARARALPTASVGTVVASALPRFHVESPG